MEVATHLVDVNMYNVYFFLIVPTAFLLIWTTKSQQACIISQLQLEAKSGSNYMSTDSEDTVRSICFQEFIPNICTTKEGKADMPW